MEPTTHRSELPQGRVATIMGFAFAAFAVWIFPPLLGGIGMVFGGVAVFKGDRMGWWAVGASVLGILLGFALNALPQDVVGA
ncbi:MAG: hypothetical protein EXQ69_02355 [Acidimicrobiia bacterium]|nr:hypothetical protein [Acidimicrobiia bacterium]